MDPNASFEDEILSINPNYDLIFSKNEESHLNKSPQQLEPKPKLSPRKMKIISTMNEILGTKRIGELPTHDDWQDTKSIEKETIAMMRRFGQEPSIDRPPDGRRTIATFPTNEDVIYMKNGRKTMPIFMGDSYFELVPRSPPTFELDDYSDRNESESLHTDSTASEMYEDVCTYAPILVHTSTTDSASENSFENLKPTEQMSSEENTRKAPVSWRRKSPLPSGDEKDSNHHSIDTETTSVSRPSSTCSWRRSCDTSSSNLRDESNWRLNAQKPARSTANEEKNAKPLVDNICSVSVKGNQSDSQPISQCGTKLYKPKDLYMKMRAEKIQKVFTDNQF